MIDAAQRMAKMAKLMTKIDGFSLTTRCHWSPIMMEEGKRVRRDDRRPSFFLLLRRACSRRANSPCTKLDGFRSFEEVVLLEEEPSVDETRGSVGDSLSVVG